MTRSFFALLVLAACNSGSGPDGETGLDVTNMDDSDTIDTDAADTDLTDTDVADTFVTGDTAVESDSDVPDTDVADTDSGVIVDPDADSDGYPASADCNDQLSSIHPGATEVCNGSDDDCDTLVDEGTNDGVTYHRDVDGDMFGSASVTTRGCGAPQGYVVDATDCNDAVTSTHPGADEVCNGVDDNCLNGIDEAPVDGHTYYLDNDHDTFGDVNSTVNACNLPSGYVANSTDCDDQLLSVHPGATEVCNLRDDNCGGGIDEGVKTTFYEDGDFDGYGDVTLTTQACSAPPGYVADSTDCDDLRDTTHPNATELCNGVDDNCVGGIDEGVKTTFYQDLDRDHYGNAAVHQQACNAPFNYVADSNDCNDVDPNVHPNAPELNCADPTDYNCDGSTGYADFDGDGTPACQDCDDHAIAVYPGAVETCNGIDDNCLDGVDEGLTTVYYRDVDSDTYGDAGASIAACTLPSGYATNATDCDDTRSAVHPGATEVCNLRDDNCTNGIDEGVKLTFHPDTDGDFYGSLTGAVQACTEPLGYVPDNTDCDDSAISVNPGASEVCNGVDDNCTNGVDEGVKSTFYADADLDLWGDATVSTAACTAPTGYVSNSQDCDDTRDVVHPGLPEVCDGLDNNCSGVIDEGVRLIYYRDSDADSYGNFLNPAQGCALPQGYTFDSTDCDDTVGSTHPNATEVCNGRDDDCDTEVDEGVKTTFYADTDHDTYGSTVITTQACSAPLDYVADHTDCDDGAASVHPGATEVCNGVDDNCVGGVDEGVKNTFYADTDHDTYGSTVLTTQACSAPSNYVADHTDCDDGDAAIHPNAAELCNGVDDDCSATVDDHINPTSVPAAARQQGVCSGAKKVCNGVSGWVEPNYASIAFYESVEASCDSKDNDCDSLVDEGVKTTFYADTDRDEYGDAASSQQACSAPPNTTTDHTDCDDTRDYVNPVAPEVCDGLDNNCNSAIDENATDAGVYYVDADEDGFGQGSGTASCTPIAGSSTFDGDCDDSDVRVYPGAYELCDGQQNDCDAITWTTADEDGLVSLEDPNGVWSDETTFFTGEYTLPEGTLHLCKGTYDVTLSPSVVGSTLVQGEGAPGEVILSGANTHRILVMSAGDVTLAALTLDGGATAGAGGCVQVDDALLSANGVVFTNCAAAGDGGAIYVGPTAVVTLDACEVSWSTSAAGSGPSGGGGGVASDGDLTITNSTLHGDFAQYGYGGAVLASSGLLTLDGVSFENNASALGAGLALLTDSAATLSGLTLTSNLATLQGGGLFAITSTPFTLYTSSFEGNSAEVDGGGLYLTGGTATLHQVSVNHGGAGGHGAGIAAELEDLTLYATTVSGNVSGGVGGGFWAHASSLSSIDGVFTGNLVTADGGKGGGLYLDGTPSTFLGGSVSLNQALNKLQNQDVTVVGGGFYLRNSPVRLADVAVEGNLAGEGGAVWMTDAAGSNSLDLAGVTSLLGNYAYYGGAIFVESGLARCGVAPGDVASIVSNTSDDPQTGAGVFLQGAPANFDLNNCDMGTSSTPLDNMSGGFINQDVTTLAGTFGFGPASTDVCNGFSGCGPL